MKNRELEILINKKLNSVSFNDYVPNGLQVEGKEIVNKVITGVTASQALINEAICHQADAIIVHHGYFWKKESPIISGIKRNRLKTLLSNDINLYSWHLPLDVHPELGNNIQLAALLDINVLGKIEPLLLWGKLSIPLSGKDLASLIKSRLGQLILWYDNDIDSKVLENIAWCTGNGQDFINKINNFDIDAFITGEVSEQTIHLAREKKLNFYAAGHHATERGGILALSKWLKKNTKLDVVFIDIPNPF